MPEFEKVLQVIPSGLLGFLELKGGEYPRGIGNTVQPVWDLQQLYANEKRECLTTAGIVPGAAGTQIFPELLVPQTEIWRIEHYSVRTSIAGAGVTQVVDPIIFYPTSGASVPVRIGLDCRPVTVGLNGECHSDVVPFYAPPGSQLGFNTSQFVVGVSTNGTAVFSRFLL